MQAGRQKGALPLIRKFNEHSERLLNSALYGHMFRFPGLSLICLGIGVRCLPPNAGDWTRERSVFTIDMPNRWDLIHMVSQDPYGQIDIDDLHDSEISTGILLEMKDRQRYFEGRMASQAAEDAAAKNASLRALIIPPFMKLCTNISIPRA